MKQLLCITSYIFFFSLVSFYPDSFRVSTLRTCSFEEGTWDPISFTVGYNDAVAFTVKSDCIFLEGMELEIKQNKTSMNYPNALAYTIYTAISPEPAKNRIDYTAKRVAGSVVPHRYSHIVKIPLRNTRNITAAKDGELIPLDRETAKAPFMLRFSPLMKGLPDSFEKEALTLIVRPLLIAEGGLRVNLMFPKSEHKPVTVKLNDDYLTPLNGLHLAMPGTYTVTVSSDAYRTEVRSCIIERGKTTDLEIRLTSITPLLRIRAPENVVVLLDDRALTLSQEPIPIESGVHLVVFKMGSYELTRQISVEEGKTYELTMTMDVLMQELRQ